MERLVAGYERILVPSLRRSGNKRTGSLSHRDAGRAAHNASTATPGLDDDGPLDFGPSAALDERVRDPAAEHGR